MNIRFALYQFFEKYDPIAEENHRACMRLQQQAYDIESKGYPVVSHIDDGIVFVNSPTISKITELPHYPWDDSDSVSKTPKLSRGR